jgi:2,3-bisphosphoglycerate-independent phosphoglycerate mutase
MVDVDERVPVVLVVPCGRAPTDAAATPVLDALAARGASGWHLPFGWGAAASSELAHWAMFGFADVPFPGRAVLEAVGAGLDVPEGVAVTHAALRTSRVDGGRVWITGRAADGDAGDVAALMGDLAPLLDRRGAVLRPLGGLGETLLSLPGQASGAVTDSDPMFPGRHPWLRVRPTAPEAVATADALTGLLRDVRAALLTSPVNADRVALGLPALDVLTTRWSGNRGPVPSFTELAGVVGAAVTRTGLHSGLADLLGMTRRHLPARPDVGADVAASVAMAAELLDTGARFVHVEVLGTADDGLAGLTALADRAIVAVTGVPLTGGPAPLVVAGPGVRPDGVTAFGERAARHGWYGTVRANELLPLLFGLANRPAFLGHRATPRPTLALPDDPEPMPVS